MATDDWVFTLSWMCTHKGGSGYCRHADPIVCQYACEDGCCRCACVCHGGKDGKSCDLDFLE